MAKVRNENIGTPMLAHYCPKCGVEVFNDSSKVFDTDKCCFTGKCDNCGEELEFPNTAATMALLGI